MPLLAPDDAPLDMPLLPEPEDPDPLDEPEPLEEPDPLLDDPLDDDPEEDEPLDDIDPDEEVPEEDMPLLEPDDPEDMESLDPRAQFGQSQSGLSIVRAEVGLDLASEKTTSVSVEGWRVDTLEEVAYEDWMVSSSSGMFGADLLVKGRDPRYVMSSAVAVRGLTASISIDASQAARLDVSLPLGTEKSAEAGLVLERTARDRVTIRSTREFYVVGTFVAVKGQVLGSFPSPDNALLSGEVPDLEGRVRITATEVQ